MWYIYSINIHKYFLYSGSRAKRSALGMRINDTNLYVIVAIDKKWSMLAYDVLRKLLKGIYKLDR